MRWVTGDTDHCPTSQYRTAIRITLVAQDASAEETRLRLVQGGISYRHETTVSPETQLYNGSKFISYECVRVRMWV
jgi:hypothetical protein